MRKGSFRALLPAAVFLVLYLGTGLVLEYGMGVRMGFTCVPIAMMFGVALLSSCLLDRKKTLEQKLALMGSGLSDPNVMTMMLIFLTAGIYIGVVGRYSAQSMAYCMLGLIPPQFSVAALFVVSGVIATAMGTSAGATTLLMPMAVEVARAAGYSYEVCIAAVSCGTLLGDNLSVISDTTIAACTGQGCSMRAKLRGNIWLTVPAALLTMAVYMTRMTDGMPVPVPGTTHPMLMLPNLLILVGSFAGMPVFTVLLVGIAFGLVIVPLSGVVVPAAGQNVFSQMMLDIGKGMESMYGIVVVTVLVTALCAMIRDQGGFDALQAVIRRFFRGTRLGELGICVVAAISASAVPSNTVAIMIANPIAGEIRRDCALAPERTACLLDVFCCCVVGVLPYGMQALIAIAAATELQAEVSAVALVRHMYYPVFLMLCALVSILLHPRRSAGSGQGA